MKVGRSKIGVLSDIDHRRTACTRTLILLPGPVPSPPLSWRLDYNLNTCYSLHEPRRLDYGVAFTRQTTEGHTNGYRFLCSFGRFSSPLPCYIPPWVRLGGRGSFQRIRAAAVPVISPVVTSVVRNYRTSLDPEPTRAHNASPFSRCGFLLGR